MSTIGYVRVSSAGQKLDRQIDEIGQVDELFEENESGKNINDRPVFQECLRFLRKGDVLLIHSIDRAARSVSDLQSIIKTLNQKEVTIKFIKEQLCFAPGMGNSISKLHLNLLGSIAEFERELIKERQAEGIKAAQARGVKFGRHVKLRIEQCKQIAERTDKGEDKACLAREYNVSRGTIYKAIKRWKKHAMSANQ